MARFIVYLDSGVSIKTDDTSEDNIRQLAKEKFLEMLEDDQFDIYIEADEL